MFRKAWSKALLIIVIAALLAVIDLPPVTGATGFYGWMRSHKINLGLDLQGGTQLRYRIDLSGVAETDKAGLVEGVLNVIKRRVDGLGVAEPLVQSAQFGGQYYVLVELPGIKDINQAIQIVGKTVQLDFREQQEEYSKDELAQINTYNADQKKKAQDILTQALSGEDFAKLAEKYSEGKDVGTGGESDFQEKAAFNEEVANAVWNLTPGTVYGKVLEIDQGYNVLKMIDKKTEDVETNVPEEVHAEHILIAYVGSSVNYASITRSKEEAETLANDLKQRAATENFESLAKQYSDDASNKEQGGDLDYFQRGEMVESFEEAAFGAKVGEIVGPVETDFGFHIIKVLDKRGGDSKTEKIEKANIAKIFLKKKPLKPENGWVTTGLTGQHFQHAQAAVDQQSMGFMVKIQFNDTGKDLFSKITERNLDKPLAIFLDDKPIIDAGVDSNGEPQAYAPVVRTVISDGEAVISGNLTQKEAHELASNLNTGAIPAPVQLVGQSTVGATLGEEALGQAVRAGIIGLIALAVFMIAYYRFPGLIATLALLVYSAISLAVFKFFPGYTLTVAGVAGFILSIGMAVDANVLIFERLKEELRLGKTLNSALDAGFKRAWSSIRDSNVSSLITCAILFIFGTGIIQGFALTLAIGVLVSMFSAITVTRTFLKTFMESKLALHESFWGVNAKDIVIKQ